MAFFKQSRKTTPDPGPHQDQERQLYELRQLLEIAKALNANLNYNSLMQSILYLCMSQLKVLKAVVFARREIDRPTLTLHRAVAGYQLGGRPDFSKDLVIDDHAPLLAWLRESEGCHSWDEFVRAHPSEAATCPLAQLSPHYLVPLRTHQHFYGLLVLSEPQEGLTDSVPSRAYLDEIATLAGMAVHNAFLFELTTTDLVTKLKLRHFLVDKLQDALNQAREERRPLSLIMLDLDHFKAVNTRYGSLAGDMAIKQVSRIILNSIRQTDTAARYSSEEFLVMLPDTDALAAQVVGERIRRAVDGALVAYEGEPLGLTVSVGIATFDPARDSNTLHFINRAESAKDAAKKAGRNRVSTA